MSPPPEIKCSQNGPYLVRNLEDLRDALGSRMETKPVMALCRCGGWANKPFCDGTHQKNGFSGEKLVDPAGAEVEAIIKTIRSCPSGALSYSLDGVAAPNQGLGPAITLTPDGPYAVVGHVKLLGQSCEQGAATEHYTLCRCGGSKNKPLCDGTHWSLGFKA